jgi:hypothetical protein
VNFLLLVYKMGKAKDPRVFKLKKDKENEDQLILRFKNLDKKQIKELRQDVDSYCKQYFASKCLVE